MGNRIPKANKVENQPKKIQRQQFKYTDSAIAFSFEALEKTEYFNLDSTCTNWASELFDMLKVVSGLKKEELLNGYYAKSTFRVHNHSNANPPSNLPEGVQLKDCYQIRISKSKGGIHGVFFDNVFYVIWLDPLHNMYPAENYGGLKKIKPGVTCCMDREQELLKLKKENDELKQENREWKNLIEKI